jgi:copper(I)-binding protein
MIESFKLITEKFMKKVLSSVVIASAFMASIAFAGNEVKVGSLKIENPQARATVPAQKMSGGFMKIENAGAADKLISASSSVSKSMELHTMSMENNVMKMREVKAIELPAKSTVELKPGGLHLMFIDLNKQLKAGDIIPIKLKFEKAGEVEVKFQVMGNKPPAHGQPGHDHSKHH